MFNNKFLKVIIVFLLSLMVLKCGIVFAEDNEFKDLFLSKQVFKDGFYDSAIRQLQQFKKDYPDSKRMFEVEFLIARCYLKQGHLYKASSAFEELLKKSKESAPDKTDEIMFWSGETYFKGKDYKRARVFYQKIVDEFSQSHFASYASYNSAWASYELKDFSQAKNEFEYFINKFPNHEYVPEAQFKIGEILFESNQHAQAQTFLLVYLKKQPKPENLARAHCLLGEIFYRMGNYSQAIEHYKVSLEKGPSSNYAPYARYGIGWAYFDLGDYKQSLKAFEDFLEFFSAHKLAEIVYLQAGESNRKLEQYDKALELYDEMIKKFPNGKLAARALFAKAKTFSDLNRTDQAISCYQSLVKQFPQNQLIAEVHYNLGILYLKKLNDKSSALKELKLVIQLTNDPKIKVNALSKIADIYLESGDVELAQKGYDKILIDFADSPYADYAQYQLGISFLKQGRLDAAILAFNNVINNFPQSASLAPARYQLGIAYFKKGNYSVAIRELNSTIEKYPDGEFKEQAQFHVATAFYNLKKFDDAIAMYNQIIKTTKDKELLWRCLHQRAWAYYNSGKEKEAVNAFIEFIAKCPEAPIISDTQFWLGKYYQQNEQYNKAREYFNLITKSNIDQNDLKDDALFQTGICFLKSDNKDLALEQFNLLKHDFPDSDLTAEAMLKIVEILTEQGKIEKAELELKQMIKNYAGSLYENIAYQKLADIEQKEGEYKKALSYLGKALQSKEAVSEFKAQLQFQIATISEKMEDYDQAIDEYLKVIYLYPNLEQWVGQAYLKIGEIFEFKKDYEKAQDAYNKIIIGNLPKQEIAKERLQWIKANVNTAD
ncbi:MAG: tetratricopeptide repeat protein [Candidatus Omnitrophica bacterium]|nr:tetratricopeptide repeat protein [Candidatus Omnitrophota bacterium]